MHLCIIQLQLLSKGCAAGKTENKYDKAHKIGIRKYVIKKCWSMQHRNVEM